MATDQINKFTSLDGENSENLEITLESLKSKVSQLESRISEFEKGKKSIGCKYIHFFIESFSLKNSDVVLYKQLRDESQSLDNWMAEVQHFLTAEDVGWGDVEVLEAQLEQSNVITHRFHSRLLDS